MSAGKDGSKTWIPLASRPRTQTFNTSGNVTIPYGRYRGTIEGRAGTGIPGNITGYNTNYNVSYPVANQPIANQPVAFYNVSYPFGGYNVSYPFGGNNPTIYNVFADVYVGCLSTVNQQGGAYYSYSFSGYSCPNYQSLPYGTGSTWCTQLFNDNNAISNGMNKSYSCGTSPGNPNYNVVYGVNYNVSYPVGGYNTNYNTNYNVAYPIANQPIAGYNPGNPGQATTVLGVYFPGGGVSGGIGQLAPTIPATVVSYFAFPDSAPSKTYPVTVPTGGQIIVKIE
jgi:hypothetical protein